MRILEHLSVRPHDKEMFLFLLSLGFLLNILLILYTENSCFKLIRSQDNVGFPSWARVFEYEKSRYFRIDEIELFYAIRESTAIVIFLQK